LPPGRDVGGRLPAGAGLGRQQRPVDELAFRSANGSAESASCFALTAEPDMTPRDARYFSQPL
jgi:hypothetical protein